MATITTTTTTKNPAAQALGRLGGSANTAAQQRQRKAAAKNAGRPRRVCARCAAPVVGGHVDRALDDTCGQHGWRWAQGDKVRPAVRPTADNAADRRALDKIAAILRTGGDARDEVRAIIGVLVRTGRKVGT